MHVGRRVLCIRHVVDEVVSDIDDDKEGFFSSSLELQSSSFESLFSSFESLSSSFESLFSSFKSLSSSFESLFSSFESLSSSFESLFSR